MLRGVNIFKGLDNFVAFCCADFINLLLYLTSSEKMDRPLGDAVATRPQANEGIRLEQTNEDKYILASTQKLELPGSSKDPEKHDVGDVSDKISIQGVRPYVIGAAYGPVDIMYSFMGGLTLPRLCMCLFLTNLEVPIVVTALGGIARDLGHFNQSNRFVAAYLLGYVGKTQKRL